MATDTRAITSTLSDDATFQAWATAIHSALVACGLVVTADTGQVDLTTAARPAAGSYAGYKIYRFDDSLQATYPVFLKVEYGCVTVNTRGSIRFNVSTATDGAGGPTGLVMSAAIAIAPAQAAAGTLLTSGDGSSIRQVGPALASSQTHIFMIERTRDPDTGDITSDALLVLTPGIINPRRLNWTAWTNSSSADSGFFQDIGSTVHEGPSAGNQLVSIGTFYKGKGFQLGLCVFKLNEHADYATVDVPLAEGDVTFLVLPSGVATSANIASTLDPGFRWV